jgi:maltoporin
VACVLAGLILQIACPLATAAAGDSSNEIDAIRNEMQQLQEDYNRRMELLDERLRKLERTEDGPEVTASEPEMGAESEPEMLPETTATAQEAMEAEAGLRVEKAREFARQQFIHPTQEYEKVLSLDKDRPVKDRIEKIMEEFIDFGGYFRAGYGRDDQGGPQVAFQAPGAAAKYRLGNEAENYGELIMGKSWYVPDMFAMDANERADGTPAGPVARAQFRVSFFNPYTDLGSGSGTDVALPEAWAAIGNVLSSKPDMKFWAGNRFYRRLDIHLNDFFFYNMSGGGGGMEDLDVGFGKLALAWIGVGSQSSISSVPEPDPVNEAGFSKSSWDLRLYDVEVPLGEAEFGLAWAAADAGLDSNGNSVPRSDGVAFNFVHTHMGIFTPEDLNRFSLQIGSGPAKTFNNSFETFTTTNGTFIRAEDRDSWRFRVTENMVIQPWDCFAVSPLALYQYTDYAEAGGVEHWFSLGARPVFFFNKYLSLAFEGGVDWTEVEDTGTSGHLYKLTLAPQVQLDSTWFSRPSIRAFVTYASWSPEFRGSVGGLDYQDATQGWTYGIQMEVWW